MMHFNYSDMQNSSSMYNTTKFPSSDYISLVNFHQSTLTLQGGVLFVELLGLPPPPKKVKGWTLRQIASSSGTVAKLSYPPVTAGTTSSVAVDTASANPAGTSAAPTNNSLQATAPASWPPLRISYLLPSNVIIRDDTPTIAWWDNVTNVDFQK
jgi:hypothetical protein